MFQNQVHIVPSQHSIILQTLNVGYVELRNQYFLTSVRDRRRLKILKVIRSQCSIDSRTCHGDRGPQASKICTKSEYFGKRQGFSSAPSAHVWPLSCLNEKLLSLSLKD